MSTSWTDQLIDQELSARNPSPAGELAGSERSRAARELLHRVLDPDELPLAGLPTAPITVPDAAQRPRRRSLAAAAAAAAALLGAAGGLLATRGPAAPARPGRLGAVRLVDFTRTNGKIVARITDPRAASSELDAVFHQHGLDISVRVVPVSPSLVGSIVALYESAGTSPITSMQHRPCLKGGTHCWVGLVVPADFNGAAKVFVGRAAEPGEVYDSSTSPFAPGEVLHCHGQLLGEQVDVAAPVLRGLGLSVSWRENVPVGSPTTAPAPTTTLPAAGSGTSPSTPAPTSTTTPASGAAVASGATPVPAAIATDGEVETFSTPPSAYYVVGATSISSTTVVIWLAPQPPSGTSLSSLASGPSC